MALVCQALYQFCEFDPFSLLHQIEGSQQSSQTGHIHNPRCPFCSHNTHHSSSIQELYTIELKCIKYKALCCIFLIYLVIYLCTSRNRLISYYPLQLKHFMAQCHDEKFLYYEYTRLLSKVDTCTPSLSWDSFYYSLQELHINFDPLIRKREQAFLYKMLSTSGLVIENFNQVYNVLMRHEHFECLNFFEFPNFFDCFVFFSHQLYCHKFVITDRLCHENFRKCAFTFLHFETVLIHFNIFTLYIIKLTLRSQSKKSYIFCMTQMLYYNKCRQWLNNIQQDLYYKFIIVFLESWKCLKNKFKKRKEFQIKKKIVIKHQRLEYFFTFAPYFIISFSIMKSFQNWLDCQLYTSHLKNLTKIKEEALQLKSSKGNRKFLITSNLSRTFSRISPVEHKSQIRVKQQQVKQQMQEGRIMQQNLNLANRLFNVASVISKDKQVESYRKYQSLFKKGSKNNKFDCLRSQKLKKFIRVQEDNFLIGLHKAILIITFLHIPRIPEGHSPTIWLQIYSGTQKLTSSHYSVDQILENQVKFPLKNKLNKNLVLLMHCSRGLAYINLGQYYFEPPKMGACKQYKNLVSEQDSRKNLSISVKVESPMSRYERHNSEKLR